AGCSDAEGAKKTAVYPVTGKVLLPDGKPLTTGRVVFVSNDGITNATGTIGGDGAFTLSSGVSGEGAPAGEYKVRIDPTETKQVAKNARPGSALSFPGKYTDEDASGLTWTVKPEPNSVEFKLDNKPAATAAQSAGKRDKLRD